MRCRFVREDEIGIAGSRAGNSQPLAFTSRQLHREVVPPVHEVPFLQEPGGAALAGPPALTAHGQREPEILLDRAIGK